MNDKRVVDLARCISLYHRGVFRIRSFGLYDEYDLPICVEMDNLANRLSATYTPMEKLAQTSALRDIIKQGRQELKEISQNAAKAKKAAIYLDRAKEVYAEIEAANKLMEMLNAAI